MTPYTSTSTAIKLMVMVTRTLTPQQLSAAKRLKGIFIERKNELSLTQQKVADIMGVTQGAVYQWLNGKTPIGYKALVGFAKVLQCEPETIFPELCADFDGHLEQVMEKSEDYKFDQKNISGKKKSRTRQRLDALCDKLPEKELKTLLSVAQGLVAASKVKK